MSTKEELLKRLSEGVLEMEEDDVAEAAQEYIDAGYPALDAINQGLIDGMNQASELFEEEEYFVTDLLLFPSRYPQTSAAEHPCQDRSFQNLLFPT